MTMDGGATGGAGLAVFQDHGLPVGVPVQHAVAGDLARGGHHHQRHRQGAVGGEHAGGDPGGGEGHRAGDMPLSKLGRAIPAMFGQEPARVRHAQPLHPAHPKSMIDNLPHPAS